MLLSFLWFTGGPSLLYSRYKSVHVKSNLPICSGTQLDLFCASPWISFLIQWVSCLKDALYSAPYWVSTCSSVTTRHLFPLPDAGPSDHLHVQPSAARVTFIPSRDLKMPYLLGKQRFLITSHHGHPGVSQWVWLRLQQRLEFKAFSNSSFL